MDDIGVVVAIASIVALLPSSLFYFRKLHSLIEALKSNLPDKYEALHRPDLGLGMSPRNVLALLGYVISGEHQSSGVDDVVREGKLARIGLFVALSFGILMFVGSTLAMVYAK